MTGPDLVRTVTQERFTVALVGDEVGRRRLAATLAKAGIEVSADVPGPERLSPRVQLGQTRAFILVSGRSLERRNAAIRTLCNRAPGAPVVLIVPADSRRGVRSALEAGAQGIVFESDVETALVPTLSAVVAGQLAAPSEARAQVIRPTLSRREKQTLALVVSGLTNGEIATRLYLAESTVKSHLSSAFAKLGVRSRNEAAQLILDSRNGLATGILNGAAGSLVPAIGDEDDAR